MTKPIELKSVGGVRNDVSPERFKKGDLATGVNIELDETGAARRRLGVTKAVATGAHSLWASGQDAFVVLDGVLSRVGAGLTTTAIKQVAGARVAYDRIVDDIFWTDGVESGIITGNRSRQWGITAPPAFAASSGGGGGLREGEYLYTMTYVRADGKESGAPECGQVHSSGGISFSLPVSRDPTVTMKHLYLSAWGGELPFLAARVSNATTGVSINDPPPPGPQLRTQFMGPAPAGQLVGHYRGRAYVASGRFLWYSAPFEYELFDIMNGYLAFPTDVKTFAPVTDGIFVGTENETTFLHGKDPAEFEHRQVADYGTILGTEKEVPEYYVLDDDRRVLGPQMMWASKHGICLGTDGGRLKNLTGGRYILPDGVKTGASLLKVRGGTPHLVVSLFS